MKNFKRVLALILAILMFSANSYASEESSGSADYTEAFNYYSILSALGILEEAEYENIDFNKEISRAEFSEMIIKAQNYKPETANNIQDIFTDVAFDNEKAPYIEEAYKNGFISGYGDGTFRPDAIIKENEAVKIIVTVLGYEPLAEAKKGYYSGYNSIAQSIDLIPSNGVSTNNLVLKEACYLLYRMLVINTNEVTGVSQGVTYLPTGEPLLSFKFNIYEVEGVLNAVAGANIYGVSGCEETEIEIDRTKYYVENATEYLEFLGENVKAFVQKIPNERVNNLVIALKNSDRTITVIPEDIYEVGASSITYTKENARKTIKVETNSRVVYNGVYKSLYSNYNKASLKNVDGEIKIIDSDNDGKYDTILVWDYEYFVADSFSDNKKILYLKNDMKFEGKSYIEFNKDKESTYMFFMDGTEFLPKDLKADDIVSVARSSNIAGDKFTLIYASREKKDLKIDEIKDGNTAVYNEVDEFDETLITKKEFKLAKGYQNATEKEIEVGCSGTFHLTHNGKILVREKDKGTKSGRLSGYFVELMPVESAFDLKVGLRLLASDNNWKTVELAEKVALFATEGYHDVSEKVYKKEEYASLETKLKDVFTNKGTEKWHGGLMEYTVDADEKIKEIYVSYDLSKLPGYIGIDGKNFSLDHSRPFGTEDWCYASWLNSKMRLGGPDLVCYLVPDEIVGTVNEKDFSAVGIGSLGGVSDHYYDGFKIYDVNEDDRFVSYFIQEYEAGTDAAATEIIGTASKDVMLVKDVVQIMQDDEVGYSVSGYMRGKDFSFFVTEDELDEITETQYTENQRDDTHEDYVPDVYYRGGMTVKDLEAGDVIMLSLNAMNKAKAFRVLFDASTEKGIYSDKYFHIQDGKEGFVNGDIDLFKKSWSLYTSHGEVVSYDKRTGIALIKAYIPANAPYDEKYYCKVYQLNREFTDVYLCEEDLVSRSNAVEINIGDQLFIRSYFNETQTVIMYR